MSSLIEGGKTILVIDDEPVILELTKEILLYLGYNCVTTPDGNEAAALARKHKPELVLLDYYMPAISGERVLDILKAEFPDLNVIISSGKELDDDEKERIQNKGVNFFLNKPYEIEVIEKAIRDNLPK